MCCGPTQPVTPERPVAQYHPRLFASLSGDAGEITAAETDPKARAANLHKLDSLVIGLPLAKVQISKDEVAELEVEARKVLDEGVCTFCQQLIRKEDITKSDHVLVVLNPKIVRQWCSSISYPYLELSQEDMQVVRPQFVSAFPAALVPADLQLPTSLRFRVVAFPPSMTILTVGVAKWPGFRNYFGKGFREEDDSWGLRWRAEDGLPCGSGKCSHRLVIGDLICITCDKWKGCSTISVNGKNIESFSLPSNENFVLGATLSSGCILRIEPSDNESSPVSE